MGGKRHVQDNRPPTSNHGQDPHGPALRVGVLRLFVIVAAWTLIPPVASAGAPRERPNILWIVSEDNSPDYVGRYGDPLARTPNIDRLARQGVAFSKAHAASPVCSVARASIITGMYA